MAWEELGKSVVKIDPTQNDIKISGSLTQQPDVITVDTTVTAGSTVTYGNGSSSWTARLPTVAIALRLADAKKFKLIVDCYSLSDDMLANKVSSTTILDQSSAALARGGALYNLLTSKYRIMFYNSDTTDLVIKSITRTEVA